MAAPKGNQFWKARSRHGRLPLFDNSEQLWEACLDYFEWVEANPLQEQKATLYQGEFIKGTVNKMRAMTIDGLCIFIDVSMDTWSNYRTRDSEENGFFGVTKKAEQIIRHQKFSGAAADQLNANIIARDLGLADKQDIQQVVRFAELSDDDLDLRLQRLESLCDQSGRD